jgi:hypothetical protein
MVSGFSLLAHFLIPLDLDLNKRRDLVDLRQEVDDLSDFASGYLYTMSLFWDGKVGSLID